ncbi:glycoside hydrolase family 16 protein [Methylobacterium sp. 77]|uniref:glycoside hydrolase family 16 protein n=1 Tax=Methylobacterium sp. 77 TaxID=1101192 RepID=UPI00037C1110|nr:glycoside hydrolase family 16 protein [Methylobacterium sp. 77]
MITDLIRPRASGASTRAGWVILGLVAITALGAWTIPSGPWAAESAAPLPPSGWRLAFDETFDKLDTAQADQGRWDYAYPDGSRTNRGNQEMEYYVDPRPGREAPGLAALSPFSVSDGILTIRARPVPRADRHASSGLAYASGMLTTYRSFSFLYGYVEMRARVPKGRGLWPALWLLPRAGGWPPEIDVMEVYGDRTSTLDVTLHTGDIGRHRQSQRKIDVSDLSAGFHVYAVKWTMEEITWYFDGAPVFTEKTPSDLHQPMFLLVNLAVGGTWTGTPDAATRFPADFEIDRIQVFLPDAASQKRALRD